MRGAADLLKTPIREDARGSGMLFLWEQITLCCMPAPLLFEVNKIWRLRQFLGVLVSSLSNPKNPTARLYSKKIQERTQLSEMAVAPCQNLFNSNRPSTHEKNSILSYLLTSASKKGAVVDATNWYMWVTTYEFIHSQSIIQIRIYDFVSPRVSSHPPPNNQQWVPSRRRLSSSHQRLPTSLQRLPSSQWIFRFYSWLFSYILDVATRVCRSPVTDDRQTITTWLIFMLTPPKCRPWANMAPMNTPCIYYHQYCSSSG